MNERKEQNQFSEKMFQKLWFPAMASSVGLALGDMADAVVVGQKMGATGLAAISLALPIYMIINVFVHGLGIGGSIRYSKLLGAGQDQEARKSFHQIVEITLLFAILLSVLGSVGQILLLRLLGVQPSDGAVFTACRDYVSVIVMGMPILFLSYILNYYLRNDNMQTLATVGFTIGNLADLGMNVLFVLVLDYGASGAAFSTVLGQLIAVVIYAIAIVKKKQTLSFQYEGLDCDALKTAWKCFITGFSTSVQFIWQFLFLLIVNHALMYYAGGEGVAVFDMVQNMSYLILYLYDGTAKALQPLVSTYCGERNPVGEKSVRELGIRYGSAVGIPVSLLLAIMAPTVCRLFGLNTDSLIGMGGLAIRLYCLGAPIGGLNLMLEGYYQACEREKPAFILATLRGALVLIPCTLILIPFGLTLFWILFPLTEVVSLLFFLIWKRGESKRSAKIQVGESRVFRKTIANKNEDLKVLLSEVEIFCESWNANSRQTYFVNMAVEEICVLIMKKAFTEDGEGYIQLTVIALENGEFELHIRDNARMFNPFAVARSQGENQEEYDMDTAGMRVISSKAKHFFYRQYQGFNTLVVRV